MKNILILFSIITLSACASDPKPKCDTKEESIAETVIGGVLMSQGWGYERGCQ